MGDDELRLTKHARERMASRGILEDDIRWALKRQLGQPKPGEAGTVWVRGIATGGRILKICVRTDDHRFVITAVWPDQ